ncbi:ENR1 protein, partial [Climacteris rufus]|nr:ENR1 protein [Climacteris rufus]
MLNRIIRLQAVVEIMSSKTALALELITKQLSDANAMADQNCLALNYLLAEEGGVCGKF